MSSEMFKKYYENPTNMNKEVRNWAGVPDDRYYTVSVWPEHLAGNVFVDMKRYRVVKSEKISKSNQ